MLEERTQVFRLYVVLSLRTLILPTQAHSPSCAGAAGKLNLEAQSILFPPSPLSRPEPVETRHTPGNLTDVIATGASYQEVTGQITLSV
jgi:hypothetical protein